MNKKLRDIISGLVIVLVVFTLGGCANKEGNKEEQNKKNEEKKNEEKKKEEKEQSYKNMNDILNMIKI